jgi:hypothetical protein
MLHVTAWGKRTYQDTVHDDHDDAVEAVVEESKTQTQDNNGKNEAHPVQRHLGDDPFLRLGDRRRRDHLRTGRKLLLQSRVAQVVHAILLVRLERLAIGVGILGVLRLLLLRIRVRLRLGLGLRLRLRLIMRVTRRKSRAARLLLDRSWLSRRRCGRRFGGHGELFTIRSRIR